jgi:3-carboxy-cis,cis-muconate cycloisomerase
MSEDLLGALFSTPAASAALDTRAVLQAMLDFEAALAGAEAECGVIPEDAARTIAAACQADLIARSGFAQAATLAGNLAIPLVKRLTEAVAQEDAAAARWVHWGATSQDVIDTSMVLQLRTVIALIDADLARLEAALATLARTHAATVMPGRTWLQHALPISFGLKAAGWLSGVHAARRHLARAAEEARILQFGGATGTLASLGAQGLDVAEALARRLDLVLPPLPWHADRVPVAAAGAALGLVCGSLGKIARDISLLMQTDVAEAFEPAGAGRGGSSTMPHKRNPVACAIALSAAIQAPPLVATLLAAMPQEHERGLGGWHAEWQALPALLRLAAASAAQMADAVGGLEVMAPRMRQNLEATHGLILSEAVSMALAAHVGKAEAHRLVEQASRLAIAKARPLRDVLHAEAAVTAHLSPEAIDALMTPDHYLGMSAAFIARALAATEQTG